jgi:hypothetical protein
LLLATERRRESLSDDAIKALLFSDPSAAEEMLMVAAVLVARRDWIRIRNLVLFVVRQSKVPIPFDALLPLFSKCAANNLALEALSLLEDMGLAERWAPLYETVRAVAEGSKARLESLAPEMRAVAVPLYDLLRAPMAAQPASEPTALLRVLASAKRKGPKRRAASSPSSRAKAEKAGSTVRPRRAR